MSTVGDDVTFHISSSKKVSMTPDSRGEISEEESFTENMMEIAALEAASCGKVLFSLESSNGLR